MISSKLPKIFYGGDYNPEQWPREVWTEDMRMFGLAHIDIATVNVFSWAALQPSEEHYDFSQLDAIMDTLEQHNIRVCLATSTAAHPAWMATRYPDVLRRDFYGRQRRFGFRHNSCPNSPSYRRFAAELVKRLAERYANHPALLLWHVNNEYGGACYCDNCAAAFRRWLQQRYGSLEALNEAWNTSFWSHTFYDWQEIVPPNVLSEHLDPSDIPAHAGQQFDATAFQGISLDYARFNSASLLECYRLEYDILKAANPSIPVTTNFMGFYKPVDYAAWAPYLDVVSWDNYPANTTPVSATAMAHDLMRGLKSGQPFMLMEQTPSQQNWQPYNALKRPGVMRLWSYQAVARGADAVMFFQLRRSRGACEKLHGAVIEHVGHEHTRVFGEVAALGQELEQLGSRLLDARTEAKVAIIFDWENWWALEYSSGPSLDLRYLEQVQAYHRALYQHNIAVDVIGCQEDFQPYQIIIAPTLYMLKPGLAERLENFVAEGGTFLTTFLSGIVDARDLVTLGGYPGELRKLLGIWAEEIDALFPEQSNQIVLPQAVGALRGDYRCDLLCDLIHAESAEVLAHYACDFYRGRPALTRNRFGLGQAWYVASSPSDDFLYDLMATLCAEKDIHAPLQAPQGVEVTERVKAGTRFVFVLNHRDEEVTLALEPERWLNLLSDKPCDKKLRLEAHGVAILTAR